MAQMAEMKHFEATLRNLGSSIQKTQSHVVDMLFSNICFIYFMIYVCFTYLLYICFTYKYYCSTFTDSLICSHICCFTSMLLHIYIYIYRFTQMLHMLVFTCVSAFFGASDDVFVYTDSYMVRLYTDTVLVCFSRQPTRIKEQVIIFFSTWLFCV